MLVDDSFTCDGEGNLRSVSSLSQHNSDDHRVRTLFHGLSRAKKNIAIVVKENELLLDVILFILQK